MVKKHQIAPYLNTRIGTDGLVNKSSPLWTRICKTESFDLAMNPETEERDFICDKLPTTELKAYNPSFNTPLVMYEDDADYQFIFNKFYNLANGDKAKSELLLVFYQKPVDTTAATHSKFAAWRCDCTISISDLNSVDSTLTFDTNVNGKIKKGYVAVSGSSISFTEGTYETT